MELVRNFFKKKSYGFYVTIAVIIMTIVTMIVYSHEYGSVARYMSWAAIWVMGAGLIVSLVLTIFNLGEWGAGILAICNFVGLMQYITKIYNYVVVVMVGIGRVAPALRLEHEVVAADYVVEPVTPGDGIREDALQDEEQLVGTDARRLTAKLAHALHDRPLVEPKAVAPFAAHAIVTFAALAKQSAQAPDAFARVPGPKVVYCLAPAFFSRSMPYCSRPIFRTSFSASLRSSEYSRALRRRAFSSLRRASSLLGAAEALAFNDLAINTCFSSSDISSGKDTHLSRYLRSHWMIFPLLKPYLRAILL